MTEWAKALPEAVVDLIQTRVFADYATVSAAGVPIDTPTFCFPSADLSTIDIGTGLAYPAKAERARRNPKVGMLFEGGSNDPVVSVAGMAAVRDADLQANLERYVAETIVSPNIAPDVVPWAKTRRKVWYLARMIVCIAPAHIRWWPSRKAMDEAPQEWRAPADFVFSPSDPAPGGSASPAPNWPQEAWQALREQALASGLPGHLTLLDPDGFPLPIRVRDIQATADGFALLAPQGAPWSGGKATLSFAGKEIFVGETRRDGPRLSLSVERALPILPLFATPSEATRDTPAVLMQRLEQEAARRAVPVPFVPEVPPEPTDGARIRAAAAMAISTDKVGGGVYKDD